jgi:hypothetical protein
MAHEIYFFTIQGKESLLDFVLSLLNLRFTQKLSARIKFRIEDVASIMEPRCVFVRGWMEPLPAIAVLTKFILFMTVGRKGIRSNS